jgi:transposase
VHKKTVVACMITPEGRQTRTFATTTAAILELSDWLTEHKASPVAMESTGPCWSPRAR